jgi:alpha-galactosidase
LAQIQRASAAIQIAVGKSMRHDCGREGSLLKRTVIVAGVLAFMLNHAWAAAENPAFIRTGADGQSWTVGNELVQRALRFSPGHGLFTDSWKHRLTGTDFMRQPFTAAPNTEPHPGNEFSFDVGGQKVRGNTEKAPADFEFVRSQIDDTNAGGRVLRIVLRAKAFPLEVSVWYAVYPGHPAIRKWLSVTNGSSQSIVLSHMAMEDVELRAAAPVDQEVLGYYGVHPREIFFTGRAEDCAVIQRNARTHEGFAILNEVPGWMKRTDLLNWGQGISVMYDTDIFPFERKVRPGETFATAKSSIVFFAEGRGLADPHWVIPSYVSQVMLRKGASFKSPWFGNTWEPFFQDYDQAAVNSIIPAAAGMGLDVYTLDTGWSENYADNQVNPVKFPNGVQAIRHDMESRGMRLGMWVPLVVVSPDSTVYKQHPEWAIRDYLGVEKSSTFPGPHDRVMCLASPYRQVAADRINALIETYNLGYVKIDLTTVFNAYGEAPGCHAKGHYHDDWAQSLEGIYEGIQFVTDEIYRKHPDVLLDLTFELWGQKHIIDYGLLAAGDLDWMSNVDDQSPANAGPLQARALLYHRGLAIPVETMLIGNLRATTPSIQERFATAIGSAPVLLGDLRKLTPEQVSWYSQKINWFKKLRQEIPIYEGFFPLGSWMQPNSNAWDGYARLSRAGEGILVLFKNQSAADHAQVALQAYPEGTFSMHSVLTGKALPQVGADAVRRGIDIPFERAESLEILEIRKVK